jgi:hypothetical protein
MFKSIDYWPENWSIFVKFVEINSNIFTKLV